MRNLLIPLLTCLPFALFCQHFSEAPRLDRPVKEIIEWQTFPASGKTPQKTQKGAVYTFQRDGKLAAWAANDYQQQEHIFEYDAKGRKAKVRMKDRNGQSEMAYSYDGKTQKAEIKGDDLYLVTTQYLNGKGQVIEEKTSGKAWFTGGKLDLISRKVLNYNSRDSLFGEMEYSYEKGQVKAKKKTVHEFDPATNRKSKTVAFATDGTEEQVTEYLYDSDGELSTIDINWPGTSNKVRWEFRRKNGELWMEIEHRYHQKERREKVFKDGRPIRYKVFMNDQLIHYTDFQYVFY